jgi:maltooligosyltrehalose trehalohydrolase
MAVANLRRRLTAGVELQDDGAVHARVWAPACRTVEFVPVRAGRNAHGVPLERDREGYFSGVVAGLAAGDRYWYRLDGERLRPDPVSRWQPDGPHGPSAIVNPAAYRWTDADWRGVERCGQVLYEMHVGTFTPEGTWRAAARELEALVDVGITVIEMMPVAEFPGRFGWGYDGVNLYAPTRLYGVPDDLRAFVDRAHALGLGVILDVVYNHLGPDGNYLGEFSPDYFTDKYTNDWGRAINFEGPQAARQFFVENLRYWVDEFHLDGFRFDATQDIHDASAEHVLAEMTRRARDAAPARSLYIIAENEPQNTRLVRPADERGMGFDALWNDDSHHAAVVAMTGRREAYYLDYKGTPQELISCAKYGYLYQGQWYRWQGKRRGTPSLDLPGHAFVCFLENHDQVANSASGKRIYQLACPARYRALTALTLLGPGTPMLFQGQEFASSAPFLYFADHREDLAAQVRRGREEFLSQFPSLRDPGVVRALAVPSDEDTFRRSKLDPSERGRHTSAVALHRDLLALRRTDPVLRGAAERRVEGAVLAAEAFVLRFFGDEGDRLLIVNLGCDLDLSPVPEPLLAPPAGMQWGFVWSSEALQYGGHGVAPLETDAEWRVPGEAAILLRSAPDMMKDDDQARSDDENA